MKKTDVCRECIEYCQEGHITCPCVYGECEYEWELNATEDDY